MIPTVLLLAIMNAREGIPLPAFYEGSIMEFFFELLREAGARLPIQPNQLMDTLIRDPYKILLRSPRNKQIFGSKKIILLPYGIQQRVL